MINTDLETTHRWAEKWLVKFKPSYSESLLVSRKNKRNIHQSLIMSAVYINKVKHHKHLGVKALDNGLEVMTVFCDISKAFDLVWHKGLIYKLKRAGINGLLLDWQSDYLTNRKQRVVNPGGRSDWQLIRAGVRGVFQKYAEKLNNNHNLHLIELCF